MMYANQVPQGGPINFCSYLVIAFGVIFFMVECAMFAKWKSQDESAGKIEAASALLIERTVSTGAAAAAAAAVCWQSPKKATHDA